MAEREIVKKYSNGELTVVWKPKLCIHSAICVNTLPNVYNPNEKPWIKAENGSTVELKAQISKCPSGALSYEMDNADEKEGNETESGIQVQVSPNGPLLIQGDLSVMLADGSVEGKKRTTAFCRCGASANKPYCDGTHSKIDFKD
ncbi:(4Fe-4S)-binding protein [Ulvibacterium sp.]|uniref:(4Fe-4S)-binding protein n=1 Tax=Ulvibacterium sp. TaxID=2665914 RepID=UPI00261ECC13|nr:(4Fe-4S)-binding protein [Ulvibacterium sp.]